MELRPLSDGNALQRAYARWAAPYYARMAPGLREQAELVDRFLYSRSGLGVWLGLAGAVVGTSFGLRHDVDLPWPVALTLALVVWCALPLSLLAAWLQPGRFSFGQIWRRLPAITALALAGGLAGFVVGHVARHGSLDLLNLGDALLRKGLVLLPATLAGAAAMLTLVWGVARVRQEILERAQTAGQAAEARLQLLQAQIQPHFIFNTLAALQHWVDTGDARAGGLLRTLTAFLRGSTELLGRSQVTLGEEAAIVRQYLQIMQARLGERLRFEVDVAPEAAGVPLPPGLLLTLVENAIEHGIAPAVGGGTVRLAAQRTGTGVEVRVRDDGVGLAAGWHDGTGLANCRERLRHHGGGTLALRAAAPGTEALLLLPGACP
jgi:signal transduction histidine kinase